ncbi:MAG TPA: hypothetical protein VGB02_09035 [Pyrinomonadaceae bacterium]|jgi:amino acid transporter
MKPLSLIALFMAAGLLIMGFVGRSGSGRILSNAVIVAASFIIVMVAAVWIIAFLKNRK